MDDTSLSQLLDPTFLDGHDLYHLRYGRGAVIVATRRDPKGSTNSEKNNRDVFLARYYCARVRGNPYSAPAFEPILSLQKEAGRIRIKVQFEYRDGARPRNHVFATMERVLPADQITLEIVRATDQHP